MAALVDLDVYGLPEDSLDTYRGRVRAVDGSRRSRRSPSACCTPIAR